MSFQLILEIQTKMTVNNRRTIGQQVSRSGQLRVAQYLTSVPWVFTVVPHNYLYYPQVRAVIQAIDNADRQVASNITFSSPNLQWFTKMQGTATAATLATTPTANTQTLTLSSNGTYKAGDFIQVGGYVYKVTADSAGTTVNIHRPLIGIPASGSVVTIGNNVSFNVVAEACPTYTLNPMTDGAFVEWDSPFVFRENITNG
jgi:hypothetical protein